MIGGNLRFEVGGPQSRAGAACDWQQCLGVTGHWGEVQPPARREVPLAPDDERPDGTVSHVVGPEAGALFQPGQ